jgi:hypothetical protein
MHKNHSDNVHFECQVTEVDHSKTDLGVTGHRPYEAPDNIEMCLMEATHVAANKI